MLIQYYIIQLFFLISIIKQNLATSVIHPNVNFDYIEKLGIPGSYNGISIYKDTQQLTQITKSTSSLVSLSNDTLKLIASSDINGVIYDACLLLSDPTTLYFAGNFTKINNLVVNNIAALDLSSKQIRSLKYGLDGSVYSLYCDSDNQQVYVGGSFIAPIDTSMIAYSDSLANFGGSVALWKNNKWYGLPWKGLNGPVNSILKVNSTSIFFGGKFDTTTDGQDFHAPASQPINIPASGVSATNTAPNSASPASILCSDASSENSWILSDGTQGTWQASFIEYSVNPSLIRIVNSKLENHQTKEFSIRSLTDSRVYKLTYLDPDSNRTKTCSTNCILSKNPNVTYQDFRITNLSITNGIAIDIKSWYGVSGGLSSVTVFQSEIFSYAVNPNTKSTCSAKTMTTLNNNITLPTAVTTGSKWTVSNTSIPYLKRNVNASDIQTLPSITFYPNLVESGIYDVLLYTPACETEKCSERTDVDILISSTATQRINLTINQSDIATQVIYTGYFDVSSSFIPNIKLSLSHNANISKGETKTIVAHAIQFVKDASQYSLSSILQYNPLQTNMSMSMSTLSWNELPDNIPYNSLVNTMDFVNDSVYIGGEFSGIDTTNKEYKNIVRYDINSKTLKSLSGGGLDGSVACIKCISSEVYVGGSFSSISGTEKNVSNSSRLSNIAKYNFQKGTWSTLNGGVNGPVKAIHWLQDSQTVLISGNYSQFLASINDTSPSIIYGNGWWDIQKDQWKITNMPYLSGTVYSAFTYNKDNFFMGNIKSAQRYQSNGISFISQNNSLSTLLPFHSFKTQNSFSINAGVMYNNSKNNTIKINDKQNIENTTVTILGGEFELSNGIQNIAIYNNSVWSGVQNTDWQGTVKTVAIHDDLLLVGGSFSGNSINNLAVFSLSNRSLLLKPDIKYHDGSPANVNMIRYIHEQDRIIVGGSFNSIGSISCSSICSFNPNSLQWSPLDSGLVGEVIDFQFINGKLVTSGNFTLNNSPLLIAEYDFNRNTWGPFGSANLPGPSKVISYDDISKQLYVSGQVNNSAYLRIWNGQKFITPSNELGLGSDIVGLTTVPIVNTSAAQNVILASGLINLGSLGNVSAAFFDGENWIPYLVASDSNGISSTSIRNAFYLQQPYIVKNIKNYLPKPLVILISIAISLGIVFFIVFISMLIIFIKKKYDNKTNSRSNPSGYYGKPPRSPESLLAMLQEISSKYHEDEDKNRYTNEKPRHLEPGNQQLYDMSKSISTEYLNDHSGAPFGAEPKNVAAITTTERATPFSSHVHSKSIPQHQNQSAVDTIENASINRDVVATTVKNEMRPESTATLSSEVQHDSINSSFHNNVSKNEMSEVRGHCSPYNPFRNSEIGVAITDTSPITAFQTNNKQPPLNTSVHDNQSQSKVVSYNNNNPSSNPSAFTVNNANTPTTVRWTNAPVANVSSAVVKPVSLVSTVNELSTEAVPISGSDSHPTLNNKQAEKVKWIQAPSSDDALATAFITTTPTINILVSENRNENFTTTPPQTLSNNAPVMVSNPLSSNVRWTTYNTDDAVGYATIETVVRDSRFSELSGSDSLNTATTNTSGDSELVRWTTAPTFDKDIATNTVTSVGPDNTNLSNNEERSSIGRSHYQASLSSINWPDENKIDDDHVKEEESDRAINTNAFRLSDTEFATPIDTDMLNFAQSISSSSQQNDTSSMDSAVRWKTTKVGLPIETIYTSPILEPASATVTQRVLKEDSTVDNLYNSKPDTYQNNNIINNSVSAENVSAVAIVEDNSNPDYNSIDNDSLNKTQVNVTDTHDTLIERKSKTVDDMIANRDLNALSLLVNEEIPIPSKSKEHNKESISTNSLRSTPSPATLDGRAASKRMVEEYMSSRKDKRNTVNNNGSKRFKYKSDFKSIMLAAIENNTKLSTATEDHPHLYYAKFDFNAREHGELGFMKDDPIIVVDSSDDIWWMGYKADKSDGSFIQGVFPSNYVEIAVNIRN
ncbi:cortical protein marker for cell polarity-domain-containing protein [Cokeromyces recurvatus]|uniref:cortical protein marker for cell polarity-domain-containing protein n=1 Tax=Cokeromyces recurvatus TaxID=90255 RepID=UPI00221E78AE|nr:cortical protein marker for cell polarity-domain-containing protein [Cokeromyces recurvatus]KAI7897873.1 cortical protein marker for cell polarity-domain-containing protein [Cokeromyces recurvatus]